jgi:hypothetical protein
MTIVNDVMLYDSYKFKDAKETRTDEVAEGIQKDILFKMMYF